MNDRERNFISKLEPSLSQPSTFAHVERMMPAAVLIPIVFRGDIPHLVFTVRTMTVAHHKGQISFPGGAFEPGDGGPVDTALRETAEEIGLLPGCVRPIGCLAAVATVSSFLVTPVVGVVDPAAEFVRNPEEVAEIFELPLPLFRVPTHHTTAPYEYDGAVYTVHHYEIRGRHVWGVTGEIVYRLTERLRTVDVQSGAAD